MHRFLCVAAVALCATSVHAAEPDRFDVVCETKMIARNLDADGKPVTEDAERMVEVPYSLDLAGNRWCEETNCKKGSANPFERIESDLILIDRLDTDQMRGDVRYTRSTRIFEFSFGTKPGFAGVDIAASGPCRVEPFTGPSAPTV